MTLNLDNKGLSSIVSDFDLFFIDIWGVLHNGINLYKDSVDVLSKLDEANKEYILLTNAPRPNSTVINFLLKMGLNEKKCQKVFTSGEASLNYLNSDWKNYKFYHIGPYRDFDLFKLFKNNKVEKIEDAEFLLCTGLFDDQDNLEFYKKLFKTKIKNRMICTNPDLIVDRGKKREFCAGSIAKIFEEMKGKVIYYGKPYPEIYKDCIHDEKKVLVIGDNLNTDIKGANNMHYDSLFIKNGIHQDEFNSLTSDNFDEVFDKYQVKINYYQNHLSW